jgi:hypothetical protein
LPESGWSTTSRPSGYAPARLGREPSLLTIARALVRDIPGLATATYRFLAFRRSLDLHFPARAQLGPQRSMEQNLQLNPAAWQYYPDFSMPAVPAR